MLDYWDLAGMINNLDPKQETIVLGGVEVQVSRLREIEMHNERIFGSGKTVFGNYSSQAAGFLLYDGFMSAQEANYCDENIFLPNMIEHYSVRHIMNKTDQYQAMSEDEVTEWRKKEQREDVEKGLPVSKGFTMYFDGSECLLPSGASLYPNGYYLTDTGYLQTEGMSIYHGPDNAKWVFGSGRELIVSRENEVETKSQYLGTYNWGSGIFFHGVQDVLPYHFWGNTPDDYCLTPLKSRLLPNVFKVDYDKYGTRWGNTVRKE